MKPEEGRTIQAGKVLPMHFNSSLFDIGHVFHQHEDGDGWSSGGVAALQSVCDGFVLPSGQLLKPVHGVVPILMKVIHG